MAGDIVNSAASPYARVEDFHDISTPPDSIRQRLRKTAVDVNAMVLPGAVTNTKVAAAGVVDMRSVKIELDGPIIQMRKDRARLRLAAWAFTTRRVPQGTACAVLPLGNAPRAGDLVLARVDALGCHCCLQLVNGRRRHLFVGEEVVVSYGNRYASNQFEAQVPETTGPCHLVAGGGIAARANSWHDSIGKGPTHITPLGFLANARGKRINLADFRLPTIEIASLKHQPPTIAVVGTSMDSGKTQTAAYLVRGLRAAGLRVGYAKITGTGAGGDFWWLKDAGADPVLDFTDTGMSSTYLADPEQLEEALVTLAGHLSLHGVDAIVLEIADGVLQRETAGLLASDTFYRLVGGIVLAARDAMGASAGVNWLANYGTPVLALSGVLTAAPLQIAEAWDATNLPAFDRESLASNEVAIDLIVRAQHHQDSLMQERNRAV